MTDTVISPVMDVTFMAVKYPIKNKFKDSDAKEYTISGTVDTTTTEGAAFRDAIQKHCPRKGKQEGDIYRVSFISYYAPEVLGPDGVTLTEDSIPMFNSSEDKATAVVSVTAGGSGDKATWYLKGVALTTLEINSSQESTASISELKRKMQQLNL